MTNPQKPPTPTPEKAEKLRTLPPKRPGDDETAWADVWEATQPAREAMVAREWGRRITDEINRDPAEVERLRKARRDVREGRRSPRRAGTRSNSRTTPGRT